MTKIDLHQYESAKDFLTDIELICSNALEYNPDRDAEGLQLLYEENFLLKTNKLFFA